MKIFRFIVVVLLFVAVGIGAWYFWKTRDDEVFETREEAVIGVGQEMWSQVNEILREYAKRADQIKREIDRNPNAVENMLALNLLEGMLARDLHQVRLQYLAEMDVVDEVFLHMDGDNGKSVSVATQEDEQEEYLEAINTVVVPADEWERLSQEYADWSSFLSAMNENLTRTEDEITFSPEEVGLLTERHDDLQGSWDYFMDEYLSRAYESEAEEEDEESAEEMAAEEVED